MTGPTRTTPRTVALDALMRVDEGAYANVMLPTLLRSSGLEPRRAQTTDLVYGTLRRRRALDAPLEPLLDRDRRSRCRYEPHSAWAPTSWWMASRRTPQ